MCLRGVEAAWATLLARYAALIYTVARRTGLSVVDAEDVFQEVAVLLCDNLENLRDTQRLPGWLATVTRRTALRLRQKNRPASFSELATGEEAVWIGEEAPAAWASESVSPEEIVLAVERHRQVQRGLERLPERCRNLLHLLYVEVPPASYQDIERRLALPQNSIGPTRTRCLQKLKQSLDSLD